MKRKRHLRPVTFLPVIREESGDVSSQDDTTEQTSSRDPVFCDKDDRWIPPDDEVTNDTNDSVT